MKYFATILSLVAAAAIGATAQVEDIQVARRVKGGERRVEETKAFKAGSGSGNGIAGSYFAEYQVLLDFGLADAALYQTFVATENPTLYRWAQCFSTDGGNTFTNTHTGSAVWMRGGEYRVNAIETEFDDGFAFAVTEAGMGLRLTLLSFFNGAAFTTLASPTTTPLGADACPM